jgi:ribosomal protein S25
LFSSKELWCIELITTVCSQATGRKSIVVPTNGGFQLTSAKRKKDLRHSSSIRRKMNHKRKRQKNNMIELSPEVLKTDEDDAESTDSDIPRQCEVSDFNEKMSAWSGLGIASSILRALAEQGFVEPTEIQVRFTNQKYCVSFGVLSAMSLLGDVAVSFGRYVPACCTSM